MKINPFRNPVFTDRETGPSMVKNRVSWFQEMVRVR
jgi:hypothetical protein